MLSADDRKSLDWILSKAQSAPENLSEWEHGFVDDMTDRLDKQGDRMTVSDPQWDILERIREKAA